MNTCRNIIVCLIYKALFVLEEYQEKIKNLSSMSNPEMAPYVFFF